MAPAVPVPVLENKRQAEKRQYENLRAGFWEDKEDKTFSFRHCIANWGCRVLKQLEAGGIYDSHYCIALWEM